VIELSRYHLGDPPAEDAPFAVLDEIVIYDRALSPAEIRNHFEAIPEPSTLVLLCIGAVGLVAFALRRRG